MFSLQLLPLEAEGSGVLHNCIQAVDHLLVDQGAFIVRKDEITLSVCEYNCNHDSYFVKNVKKDYRINPFFASFSLLSSISCYSTGKKQTPPFPLESPFLHVFFFHLRRIPLRSCELRVLLFFRFFLGF